MLLGHTSSIDCLAPATLEKEMTLIVSSSENGCVWNGESPLLVCIQFDSIQWFITFCKHIIFIIIRAFYVVSVSSLFLFVKYNNSSN